MRPNSKSSDLIAAEKRANELEQRLAALEAEKELAKRTANSDTEAPVIRITSVISKGLSGFLKGNVIDNSGVAEVLLDGKPILLDINGNFTAKTYVPKGGVSVLVEAFDLAGLSSSLSVQLDRTETKTETFKFSRLNPLIRKVTTNHQSLALIIGVSDYKETSALAVYADTDANVC